MHLLPYLLVAAATAAGTVSHLVECWIRGHHQAGLAREYDRTLLSALPQLRPGYDLEHQAADGSRWLVRSSSANGTNGRRGQQR